MITFGVNKRSFARDIPGQMVAIEGTVYAVFNPRTAGARGYQVTICPERIVRKIVIWADRSEIPDLLMVADVRVGDYLPEVVLRAVTMAMRSDR